MSELNEFQVKLHQEINNLRNIEHYLKQPYLENLWIVSEDEQRKDLLNILEKRNKLRLINWIRRHPSLLLGEKSIRQLRDDAREAYIPFYSRMNKSELLIALKNYDKTAVKLVNLTNRDMILEIKKLLDEMASLFIEAKIREDYLFIDPEAINFEIKIITEAFDWMHKIHDREYQKVKEIKILLPDETWLRYKNWDYTDHREVLLLNESLQELRKVVVNSERPSLFIKSKVKKFIKKLKKET